MPTLAQKVAVLFGGAQIYYVDNTAGNDANSGLSQLVPWKTIAKLNAFTGFRSGDQILFKRGETWAGTQFTIPASGLTLGAYGSGNKPIIDGSDLVNCVYAIGKSNLRLENLELTQGVDHGAKFDGCSGVTVVDCDMHEAGNDNLIFINRCNSCTVTRGTYYNAYVRVVGYLAAGIEIADGGSNFTVDGAECYGNAHHGVTVHNHNALDPQGATNVPANVTLRNLNCHDNTENGINVMNQEATTALSLTITDCVSTANTLDGLRIAPGGQALTDLEYLSGVTVSGVECYGNGRYAGYVEADDVILRRSVFADNETMVQRAKNVTIQNCTIYNGTDTAAAFYYQGARNENLTMRNCIVQCNVAGQLIIVVTAGTGTTGYDVNYNLYRRSGGLITNLHWHWKGTAYNFADWKTQSGGDANSAYGDALFVDAATDDFTLQAGSPAIDIGVVIAGVTDGYLGAAPDAGYAEKA